MWSKYPTSPSFSFTTSPQHLQKDEEAPCTWCHFLSSHSSLRKTIQLKECIPTYCRPLIRYLSPKNDVRQWLPKFQKHTACSFRPRNEKWHDLLSQLFRDLATWYAGTRSANCPWGEVPCELAEKLRNGIIVLRFPRLCAVGLEYEIWHDSGTVFEIPGGWGMRHSLGQPGTFHFSVDQLRKSSIILKSSGADSEVQLWDVTWSEISFGEKNAKTKKKRCVSNCGTRELEGWGDDTW
jgi:hypothetical protein